MKILVRNKTEDAWRLVESAAYKGEDELQRLLADSPSLISIKDVRAAADPLVVAVREFPLPIGYLDLLAFSALGDITLIECKLASNPEIKRKVIGQALEYGAHLWQMRYEELDQKIKERTQKPLAELMHTALGNKEWDEEAFRNNVEAALEAGSFILMIVVDEITDELSRIVRFVNNCGRPAFSFAALEMRRFHSNQTEMLVPRVVGETHPVEGVTGGARKRWTEDTFFKAAAEKVDSSTLETITRLYQWSKQQASFVRFGTGSASGSFTFLLEHGEESGSVFSVFTDGSLSVNFGYMEKICSAEEIAAFRAKLTAIETFASAVQQSSYFLYVKVATAFAKPEHLDDFQESVLWVKSLLVE